MNPFFLLIAGSLFAYGFCKLVDLVMEKIDD